jgi:type IV fimbrial biogenesis protein FimT
MPHYQRTASAGFTVVELMITLIIAAVLLTLAAPAFTDLIANNRMRAEVFALRGLLMEARSEAVTERNNVTVCSSDDGEDCGGNWNDGYIAFFDTNNDETVDAGERIILERTPNATRIDISFSNTENRIVYNSRGNAQIPGVTFNGTFTFCDDRGADKAAGLIVSPVGTLSVAIDRDDDDLVNDHEGDNLVCDG